HESVLADIRAQGHGRLPTRDNRPLTAPARSCRVGARFPETEGRIVLRVGMVGAGVIGRAHLPTLLQLEGAKVVGVADPVAPAAEALAAQAGTTAYADYRQLLGKVDAVWICTPTSLHPEQP